MATSASSSPKSGRRLRHAVNASPTSAVSKPNSSGTSVVLKPLVTLLSQARFWASLISTVPPGLGRFTMALELSGPDPGELSTTCGWSGRVDMDHRGVRRQSGEDLLVGSAELVDGSGRRAGAVTAEEALSNGVGGGTEV